MLPENLDLILNSRKSEKEKQDEALDKIQLELRKDLNELYARWN